MLNRCEFIGRVGRDPECRSMGNGSPVVNISLGVTDKWKDKNTGEKKERTEWVKIVCFDENLCRTFQNYVSKGDLIRVVGSMQTRKWQDQSGADKYVTEICLQRFRGELTLLGGNAPKNDGSGAGGAYSEPDDLDDEIPFN